MMNKKNLPHIITVTSFVVFIALGLACASTPMVSKELGEKYRKMTQQPVGNERIVDWVSVNGSPIGYYDDGKDTHSPQKMGATMQVPESEASKKHPHESILDQLLNEAKRRYPSEKVDIRNATSVRRHINPRQQQGIQNTVNNDGTVTRRTTTETVYDHYILYTADVITTEPMPQPVTYSEKFTKPGASRDDIYRRISNWIDDNTQRRRIRKGPENFDRGRITGTVTCVARSDNPYIITSEYTIDVYDAGVEIKFENTFLRRTDPELQRVGDPEPIFLQSIADAALAELVEFSTTLRSHILSR
jgi:hypothetical protein